LLFLLFKISDFIRLIFIVQYARLLFKEMRISRCECVTFNSSTFVERLEVMFMVEFLAFLIIGFMISIAVNITLLDIIYIILSNKEQ